MNYLQAQHILEESDQYEQMRSECAAEAGMGAVSMGWDGYDGMAVWNIENPRDPILEADITEAKAYLEAFPLRLVYVDRYFPVPVIA